jgi:HTH-type transcriptional regulator / antitoxin HigA
MPNMTTERGNMIATVIEKKDLISEFGGAPKVITSDAQHERYVSTLLELERRESGGQLNAAERAFAELLTLLVDKYEEEHHAIPSAPPREVLRELVESNNLRQKDLTPEFGAESIVSEVLNGKRELNKDQIERLSRRFHVSPAVFFQASVAPSTKLSFRVASDDKRVFIHRKTRVATKRRSRSHRNRRPGT